MACSSPLKRKSEFSEDEYGDDTFIMSGGGDAMLSPNKKRKLKAKPQFIPTNSKHELTKALTDLSLNKNDQETNTNADIDTETGESARSSARTVPENLAGPQQPALALAIYLETPFQPFILVKPGFAAGGSARCSIWLGLNDRKLYVRKLQGCSEGTPKDITCYVEHSGIPKLVASLQHGANPLVRAPEKLKLGALESAIEKRNEGLSRLLHWSTMSEYVNGPTLLSVFESVAGKGLVFPEAVIWQCGVVLLEIVRKMRFPNPAAGDKHIQPMSHNDIFPRNILLANSTEPDQAATTNSYLIDFGIATFQSESNHRNRDLSHVVDILCGMMLNQNLGQAAKARVKQKRDEHGWPYSNELTLKVSELEEVNSNAIPYGFPPKFWFDKWVANFKHMAARSAAKSKEAGKPTKMELQKPLTIDRPCLFRGDNAVEEMKHFMAKQPGCSPYQRVWLEEGSLKIVKVEEELYWNKPEVDVPLRDGALFKKKDKEEQAPYSRP